MSRLSPRTASPSRSIWTPLPEDVFRQHLVALEQRTNAVPMDPQVFPLPIPGTTTTTTTTTHTLPLQTEHRLASALAFLAAVDQGAQSVAAACLEEHVAPAPRLTVRFAALDLASPETKAALQDLLDALCAPSPHTSDAQVHEDVLFAKLVSLHQARLLARLRSRRWQKPAYLRAQHKKPLCADLANVRHRVQFLYAKKEAAERAAVEARVARLAAVYEAFENADERDDEHECSALEGVVRASFAFCTDDAVRGYAARLAESVNNGTPTQKVAAALKTLRQVEKVGCYLRIARQLVATRDAHAALFGRGVEVAFLRPYAGVATGVGYEAWATSVHVHAEVQLAVHYDVEGVREGVLRPRTLGTSKWLCYLCYVFLREHAGFAPANTHGRLYDQWTIPDLEEYGAELVARYRGIVRAVDDEVRRETGGEGVRWRAEPMTSRQNLLCDDEDA